MDLSKVTHPTYDVKTGLIEGCMPGSYEWKHEYRHGWQEKKYKLGTIAAKIEMPLLSISSLLPSAIILGADRLIILLLCVPFLLYFWFRLALELDAEAYARNGRGVLPGKD